MFWPAFWIVAILIIAKIVAIASMHSWRTRHNRTGSRGLTLEVHANGIAAAGRPGRAFDAKGYRDVPPIEYWDQFFLVEDAERSPKDFG